MKLLFIYSSVKSHKYKKVETLSTHIIMATLKTFPVYWSMKQIYWTGEADCSTVKFFQVANAMV